MLSLSKSKPISKISILWKVLFLLYFIPQLGHSQRCPVPQLLQQRNEKSPQLSEKKFEKWIKNQLGTLKALKSTKKLDTVQIPVVFHIIHNNEELGSGSNLSDQRIIEQLRILNEDFNRKNADTVNTPAIYQSRASSFAIEFILAQQDPDGNETSGILRTVGSRRSYRYAEREILSAESYWPAEDYLNIWIADLNGSLGWAEFPVSTLEGLEEASNNRLIDGVTVDYEYVGINPSANLFPSYGRTLSHEMGHFFGLRHIWGDNLTDCEVDDYCEDTPATNEPSYGCNTDKTNCSSDDMVQNFMDYSDDACMNLFTLDQRNRVRTVLENSPRRNSLTVSSGLSPPTIYAYDLALKPVYERFYATCDSIFTPKIVIKNNGTSAIAEYEVILRYPNGRNEIILINDSLNTNEEKEIIFPDYIITSKTVKNFDYDLRIIGDNQDQRVENNITTQSLQPLINKEAPYGKSFGNGFSDWYIRNSDNEESWITINNSAGIPFYGKNKTVGEKEILVSPNFDISNLENPTLSFSYAQTIDENVHQLKIYANNNCSNNYDNLVFSSSSKEDFYTAYPTDTVFNPKNRLDWENIEVDLSTLNRSNPVSFLIEVTNQNGNHFYYKEFYIGESSQDDYDLKIVNWENTNVVVCNENLVGNYTIRNDGREAVNSFTINYYQQSELLDSILITDPLSSGESLKKQFLVSDYSSRTNDSIRIELIIQNDTSTVFKRNYYYRYRIDCENRLTPVRFDITYDSEDRFKNFPLLNQKNIQANNTNNSIRILSSQTDNNETILVSPTVKVADLSNLGLIFDYAYNKPLKKSESLQVYLSSPYSSIYSNLLLFSKSGDSLATDYSNNEAAELKWENVFIDISDYAYLNTLQVVFKIKHSKGQDVHLKNTSLFIGEETPPPFPNTIEPISLYPNPARDIINLHLNLKTDQKGFISIIDVNGKSLIEIKEPKLLNQFIQFNISDLPQGMYFIRVYNNDLYLTKKFIKTD